MTHSPELLNSHATAERAGREEGGADAAELVRGAYTDGTQLIGGAWVGSVSGELLDVRNPATGETIARIPRGDAADVASAVAAAEAALPGWRRTSPSVRAERIRAYADLLALHADTIDALERLDVGRPLGTLGGPRPLATDVHYFAGLVDKLHGRTLPTHDTSTLAMTVREPYGVVASIIPWNAPGSEFITDVVPAIGAGNTIVVKPSEEAPLVPLLLARLAGEAGIPDGVVNVVTGLGAEAGAAVPAHPGIRRVSFTGSPATGRLVMAACAENITPLHLELGGKSPQVVFADADLDTAIPLFTRSITANSGQICAAGSRIVVERSVQAEVVARLAEAFESLTLGRWDQRADMGPLISERQYEKVREYIRMGEQEGARRVTGGEPSAADGAPRGNFVAPTLFADVRESMTIAQEEIFGPVLSVIPVDSEEEAIAVANGTRYGLAASVWTRDVGRAVRVAREIEAGHVHVNTVGSAGAIGAPFGGYKSSGFGRTLGIDAVADYTQTKTISLTGAPPR